MSHQSSLHDPHRVPTPHVRPALPRVEVEITRGRARHKFRPVQDATYLFGAGPECDLVLGDPQFPEVHGYLLVTPEGVSIRRLGAAPEITVEGAPITSAALKHNDRIRTGPYEFRIHIRWARGGSPLHLPREVVSDVPHSRVQGAAREVASLLDDIENELAADQRQLRLFVGQEEIAPPGAPPRPLGDAPPWRHISRELGRG